MFGWFNSREREIRQLNKDAQSIIAMAEQTYRNERQAEIAVMVRDGLSAIEGTCGDAIELERVKARHREARRSLNQVALTGHTLLIIYLRAQSIGDRCQPALDAIDAFVERWAHTADEQGVLPG